MNRRRWFSIGACAILIGSMLGAIRLLPSGSSRTESQVEEPEPPSAKVVVTETEHDFGFLDISDSGRHAFLIRNEGKGPLLLGRGSTSCTCTMSELPPGDIPPGAAARVTISTKATASRGGVFRHSADVRTNDPDCPTVTFTVRGVYRTFLAAKPERVCFPRVSRVQSTRDPRRAEVAVYSQAYEEFALSQISSTLEGLSWEITPLDQEALRPLEAKSGYRLSLQLPEDLPDEGFSGALRITAVPQATSHQSQMLEIPLTRRSVRSFQLFGPDLMPGAMLRLGTISRGTSRRSTITLKVGDDHRALAIRNIAVDPAFVQVRVEPLNPESPQLGLYRIRVEVPEDAPMCNHWGVEAGTIRIETDHPKTPELSLTLEFAVAGA